MPVHLQLAYSEGTVFPAQSLVVAVNDYQSALLWDDGLGLDAVAGDGIFNGELDIDLNELASQYQRISDVGLSVPGFNGRDFTGWADPPEGDFEWLLQKFEEGTPIDLKALSVGFPQLVSAPHSLFVTEPGTVADPSRTTPDVCQAGSGEAQKKWTFGYLMTRLANTQRTGIPASAFVRQWLETWSTEQYLNGWEVPRRDLIGDLISQWEGASGGSTLDLDKAPFELLAIVNRIDLAENPAYGGTTRGEVRFIFGWVDLGTCQVQPFTVSFDFGVPEGGCAELRTWAQQWKDLDVHVLGSQDYNQALEALTEVVTRADAAPDKPNGSALNQLRTNEQVLGLTAQLREFHLPQGDGPLTPAPVPLTPDSSLNGTEPVTAYLGDFTARLLGGQHEVPLVYWGQGFVGGAADVPSPSFFWQAEPESLVDADARHQFSLNTCSGCHAGETGTSYMHLDPGTGALSGFLTGKSMPDPADPTLTREYADLTFRAARLDSIANQMCLLRANDFRPQSH
ncbi:hypothetical protein ACLESO_16975 [Pyxidicoccus sp. 3LG]